MNKQDTTMEKPFRIWGPGVFSFNQPRYKTLAEARADFRNHARRMKQSWLYFEIYEDLENGDYIRRG